MRFALPLTSACLHLAPFATGLRHLKAMSSASLAPPSSRSEPIYKYAYCHGFLSDENSVKGVAIKKELENAKISLDLLNLNSGPDKGGISYSGGIQAIRDYWESCQAEAAVSRQTVKLRLVGSSLGGYVVARYAELYPETVDRVVLLCPGFNLSSRWPTLFGQDVMKDWKKKGGRSFTASSGEEVSIPWTFVEDGMKQPAFPAYTCPAVIIHGINDEVVPCDTTKELLNGAAGPLTAQCSTGLFVPDGHALLLPTTLSQTFALIRSHFDLPAPSEPSEPSEHDVVGEVGISQTKPLGNIEVERKFAWREGLEELIASFADEEGRREEIFTDSYWDLPPGESKGLGLMENDIWLRQRGGVWELKIPTASRNLVTTAYQEVKDCRVIASFLAQHLASNLVLASGANELEEGLKRAGISVFATYTTHRRKYRKGAVSFDLDQASYGYGVVELEVMCCEEKEVEAAERSIMEAAKGLGMHECVNHKGKLVEYISRYIVQGVQLGTENITNFDVPKPTKTDLIRRGMLSCRA
ncbi:unnamed protein product [Chrysoparadoxa australica]